MILWDIVSYGGDAETRRDDKPKRRSSPAGARLSGGERLWIRVEGGSPTCVSL